MRCIVIFGNSGSGKSTFANHLSEKHNIAHLDLDTLAWTPSDPPTRQSLDIVNRDIHAFMDRHTSWVIEGCYSDILEMVIPHANDMYFLNLSIEKCIENAKKRPWEPHKYSSKEQQDANLDMLIDWIKAYPTRTDTFSQTAHQTLFNEFRGTKHMYVNHIEFKPIKKR